MKEINSLRVLIKFDFVVHIDGVAIEGLSKGRDTGMWIAENVLNFDCHKLESCLMKSLFVTIIHNKEYGKHFRVIK